MPASFQNAWRLSGHFVHLFYWRNKSAIGNIRDSIGIKAKMRPPCLLTTQQRLSASWVGEKYMIRRCFTGRPRQIIHRCDLCENVQWAWKHEFRYKHKQTFKTHVVGRIANMLNVGDCLDVYRYNILVEALLSLVDPSRGSWFEGRCYITN